MHTWDQAHIRNANKGSGFWPVEFASDGVYRIEVRRWPSEIDIPIIASILPDTIGDVYFMGEQVKKGKGISISAIKVRLEVGDKQYEQNIEYIHNFHYLA